MSKERARRRAERERLAERRAEQQRQVVQQAQAKRRRQQRWSRWLGRDKPIDPRVRERRAMLASAVLVIVMLTWVASRSLSLTLGVFIVAAVAVPVAATLMSDKRR